MRASSLILALAPVSALAQGINITETNEVDLANGKGNLGWGATDLPFGYSAGSGLNFAESMCFLATPLPPFPQTKEKPPPSPPLLLSSQPPAR